MVMVLTFDLNLRLNTKVCDITQYFIAIKRKRLRYNAILIAIIRKRLRYNAIIIAIKRKKDCD